ncbi:putative cytochrome P450 6a14 [Lycorma delicatula]|uniref:putative cytochrome P450 6a14 n=1 Tax=Lycorma delicatula TaxID=130591 RepID=UPI003F51A4AE
MEYSWVITAALAIIMLYCMFWWKDKNITYWKELGVPIISSESPIIEFIVDIIIYRKGLLEIFNNMYKKLEGEKFGGYFHFLSPAIMIRDTELINEILIKDFTHFEDRGPPQDKDFDTLISLGVNNLHGDEWRAARHKLTPTFTSGKLKMMFEPIKECCNEGILFLNDKIGQDIEARSLMGKFIIKIIANIGFGISVNTFNEEEAKKNEFIKTTTNFFKPSLLLLLKFVIMLSNPKLKRILKFKLVDDGVSKFFQKTTKEILKFREENGTKRNDFLQLMIDEKKREQGLLRNHDNKHISCNDYEKEDGELLDQLKNTPISNSNWSTSEMFSDEFIAAQAFLFISGGTETTSGTLSLVLYYLSVNQDVQKQAKKEITNILSTHEFNYQAVKKMVYLEQIIYETLRLLPVTPILLRYCTKDYKIPDTDVIIKKGNVVCIPSAFLQKDPQYFPDPEKFNPDRFEDMENIPKGVFFPFGSGPRICIAMRLAMLKMKIILATLLSNYTITLSEKTKLPLKMMKHSFLTNVEGGVWIKFEKDK